MFCSFLLLLFVTLFNLMFKTQYEYIHELAYILVQSKFCSYLNHGNCSNITDILEWNKYSHVYPITNKSTIEKFGFNRMFQEHDDLRKFFKFGDYKESSDLLQNKIFQNHVMLVMHTLDEAICSMGDTDYVMEMLRGVGKSHRRLPEFNFMIFSVSLNFMGFKMSNDNINVSTIII